MTNLEKYNRVFKEIFEVGDDVLNGAFTFQAVDSWDSMRHLALISELEDTFELMFETDDILHFGGYKNGIDILKRYGVKI